MTKDIFKDKSKALMTGWIKGIKRRDKSTMTSKYSSFGGRESSGISERERK